MPSNRIPPSGGEPLLAREVFGNVSDASQILFYLLAGAATLSLGVGLYRRVRLYRLGDRSVVHRARRINLRRAFGDIFLQRRMITRPDATIAHRFLFCGFAVLFVGTILIALEHLLASALGREAADPVFHKGTYFAVYETTLDLFGIAFLWGCLLLIRRRWRADSSIARRRSDWLVLGCFALLGGTGFLTESLRILHADTPQPGWSPVGYAGSAVLKACGISRNGAAQSHLVLWWVHAVLALAIIAAVPYTRLLHAIAGAANLWADPEPIGAMSLVTYDELENAGRIGVGEIDHFSATQLLQLDACVACGRCEDACPAFEANQPLSPRDVVQDLRAHLNRVGAALQMRNASQSSNARNESPPLDATESLATLHGETIAAETLWSCTTCGACADVCPLGVHPLKMITDMRRYLVGEGQLRGAPATSLQKSQRSGNPWGLPARDRFVWSDGLETPTAADNPDFEFLYWVGCAASYDRRIQNIARSVVTLLSRARVSFAVLGAEERCTGESARRMGDEFLFQELAAVNVANLNKYQVRKIVAHCPHCVNSFRQDYPQVGGRYEVIHHSQLLAQLVDQGRLEPSAATDGGTVVYHDPCYLARASHVTEPPRQIVAAAQFGGDVDRVTELPRNRRQTSCCGGGGGRMWFDDAPSQRSGKGRVDEILASGAETVAVACPFCMAMLSDGLAAASENNPVQVRDIAEILADSLTER